MTKLTAYVFVVSLGATALGPADMDAQTMLLNAGRDVGGALAALLHSVKSASARLVKVGRVGMLLIYTKLVVLL